MATADKLLDLARQEIGVSESPSGSNCVKYNTAYYGRPVSGGGYPWCCVFIWWLFREAGCGKLFFGGRKTASCGALATWARQQGRFITGGYCPGDLVFLGFSGYGIQHIGIVESIREDGALVTIEGNTGSGNDANGGQVQRRVREMKYVRGALRPDYEEDTVTQEQFDRMMEVWLEKQADAGPGMFSQEARAWAEDERLILGDSSGRKQYKSFCTREQVMVFLHRFLKQLQHQLR